MYIMFPIGWMWYFGTNLETRFTVPDFWPEPGTTHTIPFEKEDLKAMGERLKADRVERRRRRLEQARMEMREAGVEEKPQVEERLGKVEQTGEAPASDVTSGVGAIEKWARGR
jgi:protein PET100